MKCDTCFDVKDKPLTYARCAICGYWRKLTPKEQLRVEKRKKK
jgi:hypothetical protein